MSIAPYAAGAASSRQNTERLVEMRAQMSQLERQLSSGKIAESYGALGFDRRLSLDARAKMSSLTGFQDAIADAQMRLKLMTQSLTSLQKVAEDTRHNLSSRAFAPDSAAALPMQEIARQRLSLAIDALNVDINGRHLFTGQDHNTRPVEGLDRLLAGDGDRVGLNQLILEHVQAHTGADAAGVMSAPGRMTITTVASDVTLSNTVIPFGFKIPGGSRTFEFDPPPAPGQTIAFEVTDAFDNIYPITLVASANPQATNEFSTVGTSAAVAASFETALRNVLSETARTGLAPRVAMDVAQTFFSANGDLVERVAPSPAWGATELEPGDAATQVIWYRGGGEVPVSAAAARSTAPVRIDANQHVGLGAQANEEPIGNLLASLATLATVRFENTEAGRDAYDDIVSKLAGDLNPAPDRRISAIATELVVAGTAMEAAGERHTLTEQMLLDIVDHVEAARPEKVAAELLSLQTRLQASYQTTTMLARLSLVNYL